MKLYIKKDTKLGKTTHMFESLKEDYKGVTPVDWEYKPMKSVPRWETYSGGDKGLSKTNIQKDAADLFNSRGYEFDHLVYLVSDENWEAHGIGGWNLGRLYSNYAVQIVKAQQSGKWAGKTLKMEVAHAFDELAPIELGKNLNRYVKKDGEYLDYDIDIVHGRHPYYGKKQDDGSYFTDYDYTKLINDFEPVIAAIYAERRRKKKKERIKMLKKIVRLYRKVLQLKSTPTASPLEGKPHHHE